MRNVLIWINTRKRKNGDMVVRKKVLLKTGNFVLVKRVYDGDKSMVNIARDEIEDIRKADRTFYGHKRFLN